MIEVSDLTKRYGGRLAVEGLSFQVRPGVVTGFLGPNGAGKSTTMRLILGLDHPTRGTATIGGKPYRSLKKPLHRVGCLLDAKAAHGGRSARGHLLGLARSNGIARGRVDEVLEYTGLTSVAVRKPKRFSLGMSQRLGIAAALLGDPEVLIFDEPVNGLDPEGVRWIRTMMKKFASEGRTVLVSSHLMSEMADTADQLIVIGRGKLIADMTTQELIAQGSQGHVRVKGRQLSRVATVLENAGAKVTMGDGDLQVSGMTPERIAELATDHALTLHELTPVYASLETVFMELTADSVEYQAQGGTR
ncbi:ABC transporter ATP-binding protein [Nonomuraea sp. NPDC050451]|uniref:ABC transporter ATP-binding protein n=1 Tax=Nonomuraea sp. NPDC050451 TaxID=3364364 RepID=UPI0037AF2879